MTDILDKTPEAILATISLIFVVLTQLIGIGILVFYSKANRELVKAKLFLGDTLKWMWTYATLAGGLFVINGALFSLNIIFHKEFGILNSLVQTLFSASFFIVSISWFLLFKKGMK